MPLLTKLRKPASLISAAAVGGVGWAVLAGPLGPAPAGVVAALVAAIAATSAALIVTEEEHAKSPAPPPLPAGSVQDDLVRRAHAAHKRLTELAETHTATPLGTYVRSTTEDVATAVLPRMVDLAGRVSIIDTTLSEVNLEALTAEQKQVADQVANTTDKVLSAELARSSQMLTSNLASLARLETLRRTLIARMRTAAATLEDLTVRVSELIAHGDDPIIGDQARADMDNITTTLEAVRTGLVEAEELTNGTS